LDIVRALAAGKRSEVLDSTLTGTPAESYTDMALPRASALIEKVNDPG
jgi:hypothetical protein